MKDIASRPAHAGYLVEFIGAAGVGKSFLLTVLLDSLRQRGIDVRDLESVRIRKFMPGTILIAAEVAHVVHRVRPRSISLYVSMIKRLGRYAIRRRAIDSDEQVYLCAEGMFHRIRQLYRASSGCSMRGVTDIVFRRIPTPDVVVILEASPRTVYERRLRRARPGDSFSYESVEADVRLVDDSVKAIDHVRQNIASDMHVIRANVEEAGVHEVASQIADFLCERRSDSC